MTHIQAFSNENISSMQGLLLESGCPSSSKQCIIHVRMSVNTVIFSCSNTMFILQKIGLLNTASKGSTLLLNAFSLQVQWILGILNGLKNLNVECVSSLIYSYKVSLTITKEKRHLCLVTEFKEQKVNQVLIIRR